VPSALLHLVRHAQAAGSDDGDPSLSDTGRAQADALGSRLALVGASAVLHGPRRRAEETATRVADKLIHGHVEACELLNDRTPVPSPQHFADYPENYWDWLAGTPTDEQDIDGRQISLAASRLAASAQAADAPLIAITHAFVIGWIVQTSLAAPADAWMTLCPANASLTTFDCSRERMRLLSYNDTGHLQPR
jgi:broad specificity phosphatase PhoE